MDKQTTELLQQLAAKLGTTAEHLWVVLLKQAYVEFWTDIYCYVAASVYIFLVYKFVPIIWDRGDKAKEENESMWDDPELKYYGVAAALLLVAAIVFFISVCSIPSTITKLANPEYWALKQVFEALK